MKSGEIKWTIISGSMESPKERVWNAWCDISDNLMVDCRGSSLSKCINAVAKLVIEKYGSETIKPE
jgi:hypothetical protein